MNSIFNSTTFEKNHKLKHSYSSLPFLKKLSIWNVMVFFLTIFIINITDYYPDNWFVFQINLFSGLLMLGTALMSLIITFQLFFKLQQKRIWLILSCLPFLLFAIQLTKVLMES